MDNYDQILHELRLINANFSLHQAMLMQVLNIILPHPNPDLYAKQLDTGANAIKATLDNVEKLLS